MVQIKWTPQSLDDIEAIANFIARDSDYYAQMYVINIFDAAERLELFPESGRIVPELNRKEIREVIFGSYSYSHAAFATLCYADKPQRVAETTWVKRYRTFPQGLSFTCIGKRIY